jgi:4-hydroxy-tetrahydrodipicolinate synthase
MSLGGKGVISVLSNILPKEVKELCSLIKTGNFEQAQKLNDALLPVANACFCEVNPIPVKAGMNFIGFEAGTPRAPLTEIEPQNAEKLANTLRGFGLEIK